MPSSLGRHGGFAADDLARPAPGFDFGARRDAERAHAHHQLFGQFAFAENFHSAGAAVGQAGRAQSRFIHAHAVVEPLQFADVHRDITRAKPRVVEPALGDAADERHLAAFKTDANRAAGTRRLALAAATARLAMTAGFTLAEPFAAMLGARTGFQIM